MLSAPIHATAASRGDVWFARFSPTVGREQRGDRPALVVSANRLNQSRAALVMACPLTTTGRGIPWHVAVDAPEGGLTRRSFILCEQMRAMSTERFRRRVGRVEDVTMALVEERLRMLMGL